MINPLITRLTTAGSELEANQTPARVWDRLYDFPKAHLTERVHAGQDMPNMHSSQRLR